MPTRRSIVNYISSLFRKNFADLFSEYTLINISDFKILFVELASNAYRFIDDLEIEKSFTQPEGIADKGTFYLIC